MKGEHIRSKVNPYEKQRADEMEEMVKRRTEQLKTELPETIKKCKTVGNLPACAYDVLAMLNFSIEVLGV